MSASTRPTFLPIRASATARLAATVDLPTPPLPLPTAMIVRSSFSAVIATWVSATPGTAIIAARTCRSSVGALLGGKAGRLEHDRGLAVLEAGHGDAAGGGEAPRPAGSAIPASAAAIRSLSSLMRRQIGIAIAACHCFSAKPVPIGRRMRRFFGWGGRPGAVLSDNRGGPWGPGGGDDGGSAATAATAAARATPGVRAGASARARPRRQWRRHLARRVPEAQPRPLRRRLPGRRAAHSLYGLLLAVLLWVLFTCVHRIGPQERGVVTTFGRYSGTLQPGIGFSWPYPIGSVTKVDVAQIRDHHRSPAARRRI